MKQTGKIERIERILRTLYLYPDRSEAENAIRGGALILSWIIGVALQYEELNHQIGGAFLMFSFSVLLEFVQQKRKEDIPRWVKGILCTLAFYLVLGSFILAFRHKTNGFYKPWTVYVTFFMMPSGWAITIYMIIMVVVSFFDLCKKQYKNQKKVTAGKRAVEQSEEEERELFERMARGEK